MALWLTKRLSEVADTQYGLSEPMNEDGKGFRIFRMGEVQDGRLVDTGRMKFADISRSEFEVYKLRRGDVLFNRTNSFELVGKTGIFDLAGDYCFASYLVRLNLDRRQIVPEFLNYFMNSDQFQKSVKGKASKSINQANINATILSNEVIRFPEALAEQRRIAGILKEAFKSIAAVKANAEKSLQNARALFSSQLQATFARIHGSRKMPIRDIAETFDGPHATPKTVDDGPVFLGISALQDGIVNLGETRHVTATDYLTWTRRVKPIAGDVVFSYETRIGQVALIPKGIECCLGRRMGLVRPDPAQLDAQFFVFQYLSPQFQEFLADRTIRGATVDRISIKEFPSFEILVPRIEHQQILAAELESFRQSALSLEAVYIRKLAALDELKKSLLHKAFSGEL